MGCRLASGLNSKSSPGCGTGASQYAWSTCNLSSRASAPACSYQKQMLPAMQSCEQMGLLQETDHSLAGEKEYSRRLREALDCTYPS